MGACQEQPLAPIDPMNGVSEMDKRSGRSHVNGTMGYILRTWPLWRDEEINDKKGFWAKALIFTQHPHSTLPWLVLSPSQCTHRGPSLHLTLFILRSDLLVHIFCLHIALTIEGEESQAYTENQLTFTVVNTAYGGKYMAKRQQGWRDGHLQSYLFIIYTISYRGHPHMCHTHQRWPKSSSVVSSYLTEYRRHIQLIYLM